MPRQKSSHYRWLLLLLLFAALFPNGALADHGGHHIVRTGDRSDYYHKIDFYGWRTDCYHWFEIIGGPNGNSEPDHLKWWQQEIGTAASGTVYWPIGPGRSVSFYVVADYSAGCGNDVIFNNGPYSFTTDAIYRPHTVTASSAAAFEYIEVSWKKGSHIPDQVSHPSYYTGNWNPNYETRRLKYRIYRDGGSTPVAEINANGADMTWRDTNVSPGETHTYQITSYTTDWGTHESGKTTAVTGSTKSANVVVSQGTFTNRANITWANMSAFAENIKIMRSKPGVTPGNPVLLSQLEELDVLNKNATSFNDYEAIPGFKYSYYIFPLTDGMDYKPSKGDGYRKANGIVKGYVKSKFGAGVSGVTVTASLKNTIQSSGITQPTYTTTTDQTGYYEIKDIYYYTEAEFNIVASKTNHVFTQSTITRKLDLNTPTVTGIDFTDETVFTLQGTVSWPSSCGIKGVEILVNGEKRGILTDREGKYQLVLQDEGTYTISPKYLHHTFETTKSGATGQASYALNVTGDLTRLDFKDTQTDDLKVVVQGGCERSIAESAVIELTNTDGGVICYKVDHTVDETGVLTIPDLPARPYEVRVKSIDTGNGSTNSNIMHQFANKVIKVDLSVRDTLVTKDSVAVVTDVPARNETLPNGTVITIPATTDTSYTVSTYTTVVEPTAEFIYRAPILVSIDYEAAGAEMACLDNEQVPLMEKGIKYKLALYFAERAQGDIPGCPINSGTVTIYDFVGDEPSPITLQINEHGYAYYELEAGEPETAISTLHRHQKLLYLKADIGFLEPVTHESWVLVTGAKVLAPSFVTRSPDLPMLVLHDPPGDNSYSFISKGSTFTHFQTTEVLIGGEAGAYANLLIGAKVKTPFSGHGFGTTIDFKAVAGRDNFNRDGMITTITFNEDYATSSEFDYVGNQGDVYIGAAFNQEFSFAEQLIYHEQECEVELKETASMDMTDFATTFIYTERHIKETLLPLLEDLRDTFVAAGDTLEANRNIYAILAWQNILKKNEENRNEKAEFQENISFSAGAPYTRTTSSDITTSESYEYNSFVNLDLALGAKIDNEGGAWFDSSIGVTASFRWSTATHTGDDVTNSYTVGYHLEDDDKGDFVSVDVLKDKARSVPAFRIKSGTTSCPHEEGTQRRDNSRIQVFPPVVSNVPLGSPAVMRAALTNQSESREAREYQVKVISTTNPDGAIVKLGGQIINSDPATFWLEYNQVLNATLTIERGPLASVYEGIQLLMYPTCQEVGSGASVSELINVTFQSECSNVALSLPGENWHLNKDNDNKLNVALTGYDKNNPYLESVSFEYRRKGEGWSRPVTYLRNGENSGLFDEPFIDFQWDVSNLPDGEYDLRAISSCGERGTSTSSIQSGIIDRSSLAPFGTPTPSDGYLRKGEEISVTFDKDINCVFDSYGQYASQPVVTLVRKDNGEVIPTTTQCSGKTLIIKTDPFSLIDELEGVELTATVSNLQDLSKNVQKYPVVWTFKVNATPVFWDPGELVASAQFGNQQDLRADLKNASKITKIFHITSHPAWLTPTATTGAMLPEGPYEMRFTPQADLVPGVYTGTVIATVDGKEVAMPVQYELLAIPPGWAVKAGDFEYSMSIVAQYSQTDADAPLSEDNRDVIGVFVNGTPRGAARIVFIPELNKYAAFITVYSNEAPPKKETLSFRMWNALTGVEYGAKETTLFVPDGKLGTASNPYILHLEGVVQTIPLAKGWNWVSFNVESSDMSRENVLSSLLSAEVNNRVTIKSQTKYAEYSSATGWQGTLRTLDNQSGYLIHLSDKPDTLRVVGAKLVTIAPLNLANTWNWIGYPRNKSGDVKEALASLTATSGAELKSQTSFATYDTGKDAWIGSLKFMYPGSGYKLKLGSTGNLSYTQNAKVAGSYDTQPGQYEYNMTVTALLNTNGTEPAQDNFQLGAFIDGVCRGVAQQEYLPDLKLYRTFFTIHGNIQDAGKEIQFKVTDKNDLEEYEVACSPVTFSPDKMTGSVQVPFALKIDADVLGYHLEQNYPNPFHQLSAISYSIADAQLVKLVVYDQLGKEVKVLVDENQAAGNYEVSFDSGQLPSGVYFYKLSAGTFAKTLKMIVVK